MIPTVLSYDDRATPEALALALETGQTVIFPTDTVYGLGGNPWDRRVLDHVRRLKGRLPDQPFTLHLWNAEQIPRYATCSETLFQKIRHALPGPYTLLLPASDAAPIATVSNGVVGIRVPYHPLFGDVLRQPVFATSVNRRGQPPLNDIAAIIETFTEVDLILTGSVCGTASAILDLTVTPVQVARGTVPPDLLRILSGP